MTGDLRRIRDSIQPGQSKALASKGVSFGTLARKRNGAWDTHGVQGLPRPSVTAATPASAPSLLIRPWRQSGSVVSLRDITNGLQAPRHHGSRRPGRGRAARYQRAAGIAEVRRRQPQVSNTSPLGRGNSAGAFPPRSVHLVEASRPGARRRSVGTKTIVRTPDPDEQNSLLEFLTSLQVLPPGTKSLVVDERLQPKTWPR